MSEFIYIKEKPAGLELFLSWLVGFLGRQLPKDISIINIPAGYWQSCGMKRGYMKTKDQILKELDLREIKRYYVVPRNGFNCYNCGRATWRAYLCDYCSAAKIEKQFEKKMQRA